jgi:hypothetical protein
MELGKIDIVGGVLLPDGVEAKVVTGLDDHSRYCLIATVVRRATGRAVCSAFGVAPTRVRHGVRYCAAGPSALD